VIVSVVPDGPAEKAGLRDGEILEAIGGFSTRDMSVGQATMLLQGASGTPVKVAVVPARQDGASGSKYQSRGDWAAACCGRPRRR